MNEKQAEKRILIKIKKGVDGVSEFCRMRLLVKANGLYGNGLFHSPQSDVI